MLFAKQCHQFDVNCFRNQNLSIYLFWSLFQLYVIQVGCDIIPINKQISDMSTEQLLGVSKLHHESENFFEQWLIEMTHVQMIAGLLWSLHLPLIGGATNSTGESGFNERWAVRNWSRWRQGLAFMMSKWETTIISHFYKIQSSLK